MPGAVRAEPQRTCLGCRARASKAELIRIGGDPTGGMLGIGGASGRGAYVHRDANCVERALQPSALARALRRGLAGDEVGRLRKRIEGELGTT